MPVTIVCPNCAARLSAPDAVLGKKVKCKKCDEPFVAKRADAGDDEDERPAKSAARSRRDDGEGAPPRKATRGRRPPDDGDDGSGDEDAPRPKAKKKGMKKKQQGSLGLLIALVLIGAVVLIGGGLGIYFGFIKEDKAAEPTAGTDGPKGLPSAPKGPSGAVGVAGAWAEHVDADGKYRISFPGRPTTRNETVNDNGQQRTAKVLHLLAGMEMFIASSEPVPPGEEGDPERLLDRVDQQAESRMQGATITSKQPVTHAGVNGREVVLSVQSPEGAVTGVARMFVTNGRIYVFVVVGPAVQANSPNAVKYFESLKFE